MSSLVRQHDKMKLKIVRVHSESAAVCVVHVPPSAASVLPRTVASTPDACHAPCAARRTFAAEVTAT